DPALPPLIPPSDDDPNAAVTEGAPSPDDDPDGSKVEWLTMMPVWAVTRPPVVGVIATGWSWTGLALALALYAVRMFGLTAGYHRYFSHRSYATSRVFSFLLAL